jgi:release factor glutamine methyltransferase
MPVAEAATVEDFVRGLGAAFRQAGLPTPELDARILVAAATGLSRAELITCSDADLTAEQTAQLDDWQRQRLARKPVSRILGSRDFYGRSFVISPDVLDPRPDSETVIEVVDAEDRRMAPLRIADLGTGSGCLLLTLLCKLPNSHGTGIDISAAALSTAQMNAELLELTGRCTFAQADFADHVAVSRLGPFDIILSNPPYIDQATLAGLDPEVQLYDPRQALDGGVDGLDAYRAILSGPIAAAEDGLLVFEIGAGACITVTGLMRAAGIADISHARDLAGIDRVVSGRIRKREKTNPDQSRL